MVVQDNVDKVQWQEEGYTTTTKKKAKASALELFASLLPLLPLENVRTLGLANMHIMPKWGELLGRFNSIGDMWYMRPKSWEQAVADCELLDVLWDIPNMHKRVTHNCLGLLPSLRRITFTDRLTRFAALRGQGTIPVFDGWTAHCLCLV